MRRELNALAIAAHGYWLSFRTNDGVSGRRSRAGRSLRTPGEWWKSTSTIDPEAEPPHKRARISNVSTQKSVGHQPTSPTNRESHVGSSKESVEGKVLSAGNTSLPSSSKLRKGKGETVNNALSPVDSPSAQQPSSSALLSTTKAGKASPDKAAGSVDGKKLGSSEKQQNPVHTGKRARKLFSVKRQLALPSASGEHEDKSQGKAAKIRSRKQKRILLAAQKPSGTRKMLPFTNKSCMKPVKVSDASDDLGDSHSESGGGDLRVPREKPLEKMDHGEGISITTGSEDVDE